TRLPRHQDALREPGDRRLPDADDRCVHAVAAQGLPRHALPPGRPHDLRRRRGPWPHTHRRRHVRVGTAGHLRRTVVGAALARGPGRCRAVQSLGSSRAEGPWPMAGTSASSINRMTSPRTFRIGQIVPSSNTTMETEIPAIPRARESVEPERFTFHSSRMRMKKVTKEELAAMDADSDRCAAELSDARVDVIGYACLVAIMSMGHGYHRASQKRLQEVTQRETGGCIPVVTSAGALIDSFHL